MRIGLATSLSIPSLLSPHCPGSKNLQISPQKSRERVHKNCETLRTDSI